MRAELKRVASACAILYAKREHDLNYRFENWLCAAHNIAGIAAERRSSAVQTGSSKEAVDERAKGQQPISANTKPTVSRLVAVQAENAQMTSAAVLRLMP